MLKTTHLLPTVLLLLASCGEKTESQTVFSDPISAIDLAARSGQPLSDIPVAFQSPGLQQPSQ
jgi:hypothetical protein